MLRIFHFFNRFSRWIGISLILITAILMAITTCFVSHPEDHLQYRPWRVPLYAENQFFDWRQKKYLKREQFPPSPHAILAAIDEKSIKNIGRFPWSRKVWAKLLDKLGILGAKVVAFDVIFSEDELACKGEINPDDEFAQAISRFPKGAENIIIGYAKTHVPWAALQKFPDILYNSLINAKQYGTETLGPSLVQNSTFPIDPLIRSDVGLGFIDMQDDGDGVFRHYTTVANLVGVEDLKTPGFTQLFPSFGLLSYMRYREDNISIEIAKGGNTSWLYTQKRPLELDNYGATRVRYRGSEEVFKRVSIWDILNTSEQDQKMTQLIQGKVIFVASTAFAAHDFRNTPIGPQLPGVFLHMNMLDMLSESRFFRPLGESLVATLILLLMGSALLLSVQFYWRNSILDILTTSTIFFLYYTADAYYLLPQGYEIKLFSCFFSILILYLYNSATNFYQVAKEKQRIRGTFSHYVSPSIVNEILEHPEKLKMGGEKRDITVFFSDVRDFTTISEQLSPSQLSYCLNQYMNEMTHILFRFKGTLDKYIGDAIVGYWGAPITLEHHPSLAVEAALEMIESLPRINESFKRQGYPEFFVGIGINTGECAVGNMGSDQVFSYTALGDHMNLGARLEGLCKFYGAEIIISQFTFDRLAPSTKNKIVFRHLDRVRVKGKTTPVRIEEVIPSHHPLHQDHQSLSFYHKAHKSFLKRDFSTSIVLLENFLKKHPQDKSGLRLFDQSKSYLQTPPPVDWDGVTTMTTK